MAFYPAQLQSANLEQFGIVYADEVQGHKTVANLEDLYDVSDAILSKSTTNAGDDALGQQWYVVSEGCYYRLDNWANRNQASGWKKMQNVDEEFDSLQEHGADKIKSFTTTSDTVSLNYNTWKNSTTSVDGSVTIPAATGDQAGVLTANGKDQLTQLNKLGEVTHLTDGGVFTEEASSVTVHYKCINTKEGATSAVVTKSEAIPEATLTKAGVLSAAKRNQLEQLDKIGEVTHLTDSGVFTTDANTVTLHYQCVDTNSGANSAVSTKTAVIPEATLTKAGTLAASNRNQLEQLNKITAVSHIADEQAFTSNANNVALNFKCILTTDGAAEDIQEHSVNIPAASNTSAGTMSATDKIEHDRINTANFTLGAVTPSASTVQIAASKTNITNGSSVTNNITIPGATTSAAGVMSATDKTEHDRINTANFTLGAVTPSASTVQIAASKTNITNGSSVTNNITIPGVTESAAGVMSAADKAKLNDITIPEGGVDFSGDATDVINGAGDSVDLMAKFPATVVTNLTGVTPSTSAATINFTKSAKDTLDYNAATSNTVTIPGATISAAGVMSAADKAKLNDITIPEGGVDFSGDATDVINGAGDSVDLMAKFPATVITNITGVTPNTTSAIINFTKSAKDTLDYNAATSNTVTIPGATTSAAGLMSATDKTEHDRITTTNFTLGAVTPSTTAVAIAASKTNITNGSSVTNNITLPGVTESAAGVMSAADKAKLNDITIPEGGVDFSGDATDVINGAGDSVDLMAKFPATVITNITGVTPNTTSAIINFTKSAKDTLDYNAATSNTVTIPGATTSAAGVMSAADKIEHDRINTANFTLGAVTPSASTVQIAASKTNITNGSSVTNNITIPGVTESAAGVMSATDKTEHDRINTANFALGAVTPSASTVQIAATKTTISTGASAANNITLPAVTESAAGVMSAADKAKLNDITLPTGGVSFSGDATDVINGAGDSVDLMAKFPATVITNITGVTPNTTSAIINFTKSAKDTLDYNAATNNTVTIPAVTESAAGLMSSADKAKLNDIKFVQSLTATGTQVVAVTSDTVVINSASQLNVTGINANAYNKVRFVNATSINTLFTFNNASAGNNKLLTTYYPSQIALPRYCSVEFVKSSTGWILSDLTGVTYFPDVTASETMVVTVNADRSIGTLPIRTMKEWDETVTQEQSVSQLNKRFPDAPVGFQFVCVSINRVYEKFNETNEWVCHYIWETGTEGTATSTDKGLMSAADKVKLDTTIPNYTVNGMKISTNPVLDGADIRLTGYSKPSSTSGIAATDTINAALGKLETGLSNEVTNRTKADSNLQSQITNLNNGKVSSVTKSGTGAVITGGSINGSTLTLTSGNFTFANGSSGNFTVTPPGGAAQTVSIGKPATAGTADVAKSVAWGNVSGKVNASTSANGLMTTAQVTKLNGIAAGAEVNQNAFSNVVVGGTTIAADAKTDTLTLIAGKNVTLTPNATNDSVTIASSYVNTTYAAGSNLTLSGTTFALASTISLTRVNASSGFFQQSDKRLKSDIKPLEHTIEDICSIPTDSFILNGKQDLGTIAQDLEEKFPEVVSECELKAAEIPNPEDFEKVKKDGETYVLVKEVDYAKLSILALEGIKLLKKEIDELKKELHK